MKILLPFKPRFRDGAFFEQSFIPDELIEFPGLYFSLKRHYYNIKSTLRPFSFYNFQYSNSSVRPLLYTTPPNNSNARILLQEDFKRTMAFEHFLGVGLRYRIGENIYLEQMVGSGIVFFKNIDSRILINNGREESISFLMFNISISYELRSKIEKF